MRGAAAVEWFGLVVLALGTMATMLGMLLPVNEYSWMATERDQVPADCDIFVDRILLAAAVLNTVAVLVLGGLLLFGSRSRTRARAVAGAFALVLLVAVAAKLPNAMAERAKAEEQCF